MSATFEKSMEEMSRLSPKERDAKIKELDKLCICPRCPTYIGTGEKMITFCARGKSKIIKNEKGCLCPTCPVQSRLGLRWMYYCTKGSGMEQAGMK
ncbi:Uncharacterised protein [uncultured archaeon]|nr:Uncharacterised protein [uncultured archaeon]